MQIKNQTNQIKKNIFLGKKITNLSMFVVFYQIFIIFFFSILPIVMHTTLNITINDLDYSKLPISGSLIAQAIGYSQPMILFCINVVILISAQIARIIKADKQQIKFSDVNEKNAVNTGLITIFFSSIIIAIIFFIVMYSYTNSLLNNSIFNQISTSEYLINYSNNYISLMTLQIILTGLSVYFEMALFKYKKNKVFFTFYNLFFCIMSLLLSAIFIKYTTISNAYGVVLGSIISTFLKFVMVVIIFYSRHIEWKWWKINFNKLIFKKIISLISILLIYLLTYGLMMVIQMVFIYINLNKSDTRYFIHISNSGSTGEYVIIIARVIIYNLVNLLCIILKSMGRCVFIKYSNNNLENRFNNDHSFAKYNIASFIIYLIFGLIIYFSLEQIIISIFSNEEWTKSTLESSLSIPIRPGNTNQFLPDYLTPNTTYLELIKITIKNSFLLNLISQGIINLAINIRICYFYNIKKNYLAFSISMITFITCYTLGNYFFGVYWQNIFHGLVGYMISQFIYGISSLFIFIVFKYIDIIKLINYDLKNNGLNTIKIKNYKNLFLYAKNILIEKKRIEKRRQEYII